MGETTGDATAGALAEQTDVERQVRAQAREAFRPSTIGWMARVAVPALVVAGIFALPAAVPFAFQADIIGLAAIFGCVALSMNVLVGYLGQLSLGHQAFFGIGAFAAAIVSTDPRIDLPFAVGLAAAAAIGALTALVIGSIALRVRGLYLAIVTLAFGLLAELSIFRIGFLSAGIAADRPGLFAGSRAYAYLCLLVLVALFAFDWRLMRSKAGRAILAVRDDERVAQTFGVNITSYKLLAFVISGTMAGIAGGLFGPLIGTVVAENEFDLFLALTFVFMTVVGGLGNRVGVLVGAVLFTAFPQIQEALRAVLPFIPEPDPIFRPIVGALLIIVVLRFLPGGIGQLLQPLQRWIGGERFRWAAIKEYAKQGGGIVGRP